MGRKKFFKIFLIFRKKYDIVYNSYTDVKTHKKSNFNFFFEKNVHFEVGFFLVKKWAEKNFLKIFLIFRKKYDIVYNSYTDVKHIKNQILIFFSKKMSILRSDFFWLKNGPKKIFFF